MRVPRSVMAVGGVVVAAAAIGFTNPKAMHALTAALVQVTNTATNPVVTQGVGGQAANLVHVSCNIQVGAGEAGTTCEQDLPNGGLGSAPYTAPSGQFLVITSVDVYPGVLSSCTGSYGIELAVRDSPSSLIKIETAAARVSIHSSYPTGIAVTGVLAAQANAFISGGGLESCDGSIGLEVYGYLTPA